MKLQDVSPLGRGTFRQIMILQRARYPEYSVVCIPAIATPTRPFTMSQIRV